MKILDFLSCCHYNHYAKSYSLGSNTTPTTTVCTNVKVVTKSYGLENSWALGPCKSKETYQSNKEMTQECCQAPGTYELECKDGFGDGWHGGYLEIQGKKYCDDFLGGPGNYLKKVQVPIAEVGTDSQGTENMS